MLWQRKIAGLAVIQPVMGKGLGTVIAAQMMRLVTFIVSLSFFRTYRSVYGGSIELAD